MPGYYDTTLSAERLRRCYDIAPPRARQALAAELAFVLLHIRSGDRVLELGCGYGRILGDLAAKAAAVVGIDTSRASLRLGQDTLSGVANCRLACMDATALAFPPAAFDRVICIQNGISAFHVDPAALIGESLRVARPGGTVLFSSYSDKYWEDRMEWFRLQSEAGLVGEIDEEKTGNGRIVCKDGFAATTFGAERFRSVVGVLGVKYQIEEVDCSSVFCRLRPG